MKYGISETLRCEIDTNIDDRRREEPHCHITKNGRRVARVTLEPTVSINKGHNLDHKEIKMVYEFCTNNAFTFISSYREDR